MTSVGRSLLIAKLLRTWDRFPSLRFGQLVSNIAPDGIDLFYVDDESFDMAIDRWNREFPPDAATDIRGQEDV